MHARTADVKGRLGPHGYTESHYRDIFFTGPDKASCDSSGDARPVGGGTAARKPAQATASRPKRTCESVGASSKFAATPASMHKDDRVTIRGRVGDRSLRRRPGSCSATASTYAPTALDHALIAVPYESDGNRGPGRPRERRRSNSTSNNSRTFTRPPASPRRRARGNPVDASTTRQRRRPDDTQRPTVDRSTPTRAAAAAKSTHTPPTMHHTPETSAKDRRRPHQPPAGPRGGGGGGRAWSRVALATQGPRTLAACGVLRRACD